MPPPPPLPHHHHHQMREEAWPNPDLCHWSQGKGSHGLSRDQYHQEISMNIMKHKDHMRKPTMMAPKWTGVGAGVVINCHFQNGETTCRQLSKRLPDNSTIFAAEATAITLVLNYYRHMGPVHHDVVVYSDSMSCLHAIEGEDTKYSFICHIMNLLWSLSGNGAHVRSCWIPSHCGKK